MSLKSKVLASAAAMTMVGGGLTMATTMTASAATPSCGSSCINIFNHQFGNYHQPNFILDVLRQGEKVGQPIILFREANSDPAEDFHIADQGTVNDFLAAQLVTPALALHYGKNQAYEDEYAPYGVDSGLCVGVASTAVQNEGVTLQPCGVSSKTVWIAAWQDDVKALFDGAGVPLVNGSDTNFSHPFTLTYPASSSPTDQPRPQLKVDNITGETDGHGGIEIGSVDSNQLWTAIPGVIHQ